MKRMVKKEVPGGNAAWVLRVPKTEGQKVKDWLIQNGHYNDAFFLKEENNTLLLPLNDPSFFKGAQEGGEKVAGVSGVCIVSAELTPREKKATTLRASLKNILEQEELSHLKTAFDVIGSIAILEIDEPLVSKERAIGEALLSLNPSIKTVLKKQDIHAGVFRTQKLSFVAGTDTRKTIHKENNVLLALDVEKVYFSPRLSRERRRIASLVQPGENVLVMFSGCGPYTCVIAKNSDAASVTGIELNPVAHSYALENVAKNKLAIIECILGDVRTVVPKIKKSFDRILMPLPKSAEDFLDTALGAAHLGTILHFYDFLGKDELWKAHEKIKKACRTNKDGCTHYTILKTITCGQFSPRVYRVCVDFRVE